MICEVCKKNHADIVFKTVTDGQVATRAMCLSCAHAVQQDIMRMFMNFGSSPEAAPKAGQIELPTVEAPNFICAGCGRPFMTMDEHTMAGCPHCYDAMEDELAAHFDMKKPSAREGGPVAEPTPGEAQELRIRLMEAVIREDYKLAALLRNQLAAAAEGKA